MLRFYHDAGKVLYFNETGLKQSVIIDVQWFVDVFKHVITDTLHVDGIIGSSGDWYEYYETGNLKDTLLENIWADSKKTDTLCHKQTILDFMQRLGLVAVGKESHYVPCMNRKEMNDNQKNILQSKSKSSLLVYRFKVLPFFFFFRLVVACMQEKGWTVPKSEGISYLYKNMALFAFGQYNIILSVTADSIQLQVLHAQDEQSLDERKTRQIQGTVETHLNAIIGTFHKKLMFVRGIRCQEDKSTPFAMKIEGYFLEEKDIQSEDQNEICPQHRLENKHKINLYELKKYWVF
ncbi:uncharacterized protein LOC134241571 [Saccostrea cucullata]|uniref:uncharacterized protein LOC134241571 n=1 Tax=Saccostrea cuccullata TaxID=36930 RepID=UPI002ED37211